MLLSQDCQIFCEKMWYNRLQFISYGFEGNRIKKRGKIQMKKKKKILLAIAGALLVLMIVAYAANALHFSRHFYSGTTINGIDSTELTAEEVKEKLAQKTEDYVLNLIRMDGTSESISAGQISLVFKDDKEVDQLLEDQDPWLWIVEAFTDKEHELQVSVSYDEVALEAVIDSLQCMQEGNYTPPQDAAVGDTENGYTIVPEVEGNQLDRAKVLEAVIAAIDSGQTELNLSDSGCYLKPSVYQDDEALNARVNQLNQLVSANLTMDFGSGRTETVNGALLKTWVTQDENGNDIIDPAKITEYVSSLAEKYNTKGATRTFRTSGGGTVQVSGGDYGWLMDETTTAQNLSSAIAAGTQGTFEVTYANSARSRESNDIGNSYVEISIDQQTMWCYVDGELLVETPVVTGDVSNGTETPKGSVWKVKGKTTDYTMTGKIDPATGKPSYTAHVNYWIPYSEDLTIGLHDLTTRSAFGGDIYLTNGSHGCVNTPLEAVKQIYEVVSYGFPVIVY